MFGKEGARRNYTPYSCLKVIHQAPPEAGAFHGCVFKHQPDNLLLTLLTQQGVALNDAKEMVAMAKAQQNPQLACQRHFDLTHPGHGIANPVANHPNLWYDSSVQYHREKAGGAGAGADAGAGGEAMAKTFNADTSKGETVAAASESVIAAEVEETTAMDVAAAE